MMNRTFSYAIEIEISPTDFELSDEDFSYRFLLPAKANLEATALEFRRNAINAALSEAPFRMKPEYGPDGIRKDPT